MTDVTKPDVTKLSDDELFKGLGIARDANDLSGKTPEELSSALGIAPVTPPSKIGTIAGTAAAGAAAAASLALPLRALRRAIPSLGTEEMVFKSFLQRLNDAFRAKDSTTNIGKELLKYEKLKLAAGEEGKKLDPLKWMSLQGNSDVNRAITEVLAHSGKARDIGKSVAVPAKRADPEINKLYDTAFKDKGSVAHTELYDFIDQPENKRAIIDSLEDAVESLKYTHPNLSQQTKQVVVGPRKDRWKWTANETVPKELYYDAPVSGLQKAFVPNMQTLDATKRALWTLASKEGAKGHGASASELHRVRKQLTELLDKHGPPEYRQGRAAAMEDFEIEAAEKLGEKLFRMNPYDLEQNLAGSKAHELAGSARGAAHGLFGPQLPPTVEAQGKDAALAAYLSMVKSGIGGKILGMPLEYIKPGWPSRRGSRIGTEWLLDPSEEALQHAIKSARGVYESKPDWWMRRIPEMGAIGATVGGLGAIGASKYYGPKSGPLGALSEDEDWPPRGLE